MGGRLLNGIVAFLAIAAYSVAGGAEPTYSEICSGYEQNILALGNFGVVVHTTSSATTEHLEVLKARLSRVEEKLATCPPEARPRLEKQVLRQRGDISKILGSGTQSLIPTNERSASLIASNSSLQIVVSPSGQENILPENFPKTRADLSSSFSRHLVLSWSLKQIPNSWIWQGVRTPVNRDRMYATLAAKQPRDALDFPVPPLGRCGREIGNRQCSVLDRPFRGEFDDACVVGRDSIGGVGAIVIESRSKDARGVSYFTKSWVDPGRGFIPIRIELSLMAPAVNDKPLVQRSEPYMIATVSDIQMMDNRSFYPVSWTIESRQDDDRRPDARPPLRVKPAPLYTHWVETWKVSAIAVNLPEPVLLSEIGFPEGTYCFDETKNEYFTVGAAQSVVDATIQSTPIVVPSSAVENPSVAQAPLKVARIGRWRVILANLLALSGVLVFFVVRRFRMGRVHRGGESK